MRFQESPHSPTDDSGGITRNGVKSLTLFRAGRESCRETVTGLALEAGGFVVAEHPTWVAIAFDRASEALEFARDAILANSGHVRAGVVTGEFSGDWSQLLSHAEAAVAAADVGQAIACLGTQELSRSALPPGYGFLELGATEVSGSLERLRLFLVDHPSLKAQDAPKRQRPARTSVFIGRQRELSQLRSALDLSRVVSLVGPCGIGKTALVRRLCDEMEGEFVDGIWMVELSDLADERLVLPRICRALEVTKGVEQRFSDAALTWLVNKRGMLVLDGCERFSNLLADLIGQIVAECPEIQILCCSQRRLKLSAEIVIRIGGLDLAPEGLDWELALDCDAISLFVDRAQQADRSFVADRSNMKWITRICRQLDGIPLAIELAAAKVVTLSPRQIHDRLDERFALLKDPKTSRPRRQSTLKDTLEWSVGLLSESGKVLLRRLSVFLGAFSVEVASAVSADEQLSEGSVASAFEELVECSILTPSKIGGDERYFYLNETFRLYGSGQLKRSGESTAIFDRKLAWVVKFADDLMREVYGPEGTLWKARCAAAYEDVRDAIHQFLKRDKVDEAAHAAQACHAFWYEHGYFAEGRQLFEKVLSHPEAGNLPAYPRYLNMLATLALADLDRRAASVFATRSLRLARSDGNKFVQACSHNTLGMIAIAVGDLARSRRRYTRAAKLFREVGEDQRLYFALANILSTFVGPMCEAEESVFDETATVVRRLGSWYQEADLCNMRAERELASGRFEEAYVSIRRALSIVIAQDSLISLMNYSRTMVKVQAGRNQDREAIRWYTLAMDLGEETKDPFTQWRTETEAAIAAIRQKHSEAEVRQWIGEARLMSRREFEELINNSY